MAGQGTHLVVGSIQWTVSATNDIPPDDQESAVVQTKSISLKSLQRKLLSVQFYNIISTYNAKIKIILYTLLKFDNKN